MTHTGQLVHRGAEAEWTIVSYKLISKMLEGTVISSVEDKDRDHVTRTSDTSCMIEDDTDDERKTRVHLISGSRKTLIPTMRNCRVHHWTAVRNLFK